MTEEKKQFALAHGLNPDAIPQHVAIIMDGNGRWAAKRGLPRSLGHRAGVNRLREIIRFSSDAGVLALSLYAFSTENWKRPQEELGVLFGLLIEFFHSEIDELDANDVCIRALGDITEFPDRVFEAVRRAETRTKLNQGLKLNIALNYGSHAELLRAARLACKDAAGNPDAITSESIERHLYTAGLPELDLLIRTSGEQRVSNFLLYQLSYSELLFTDDYWPDFDEAHYIAALQAYAQRKRRYGGLNESK